MRGVAGRMRKRPIPHPQAGAVHRNTVRPLRILVDAFVNTFGITPPTPETEARAGRVIAAMLVGVLVVIAAVGWLVRSVLVR